MNSEREKADILFDYGLPLQFCCHLIQFYTLLFLRVATLTGEKNSGKQTFTIHFTIGKTTTSG